MPVLPDFRTFDGSSSGFASIYKGSGDLGTTLN
jgi:hypothetical protein